MDRGIAFIDIQGFYVRAHQELQPRSAPCPWVVIKEGQVLECCRQAQAEGLVPGAPRRQVWCLCPQAEVVTFRPDACEPLYRQIWDIVAAHSPVVEPIDFPQGFADITKVVSGVHQAKEWRSRVGEQIQQQTDMKPHIGIGPGKFVARVAATHRAVIDGEEAREFLALVPVADLDWLAPKLRQALQRLGLIILGQVSEVDRNVLIQQVGLTGGQLHDWIKGRDDQPVESLYPPREERVAYTFALEDRTEVVNQVLGELCAQLASKLQGTAGQARRLTLQVEEAAECRTRTQQYSRPLNDARRLYQAAERLLTQLWAGQPLLQIELVAGELQPVAPGQLSFGGGWRRGQVDQAMAAVHSRYGVRAVRKASELEDKRRFAQMILATEGRFSW